MVQPGSLIDNPAVANAGPAGPSDPLAVFDPRIRLVAALAFCMATVALTDYPALATALVIAVLAVVVGRPCWRTLGKRLVALEGFMIMLLVMLPFTVPPADPNQILVRIGPLTASSDGLHQALIILLKTNIVVLILAALIGRLDPNAFGLALAALRLPTKLVTLLLLTVRYLDVLQQEHARLRRAMKARGFRARANRHGLRSIGYLVGMLLVRSFDRSERVLAAMRCRGFDGRFGHDVVTSLHRADAGLAAAAGLAIATCLIIDTIP